MSKIGKFLKIPGKYAIHIIIIKNMVMTQSRFEPQRKQNSQKTLNSLMCDHKNYSKSWNI